MRAVNIVGFKNSGKTTLCANLLRVLNARGAEPAALKFTHQAGLDKTGTDTHTLMAHSLAVGAVGEGESAMFWRGKRPIEALLPLLGAKTVVVEGGKHLEIMPRIVVAATARQALDLGAGPGGLALAVYGPEEVEGVSAVTDVEALADLVLKRGFALPGLNCQGCGLENCSTLARRIVAGQAAPEACQALAGNLCVTVNGEPVALGPFVSRFLRAGLAGMLGELKGHTPGGKTVITLDG